MMIVEGENVFLNHYLMLNEGEISRHWLPVPLCHCCCLRHDGGFGYAFAAKKQKKTFAAINAEHMTSSLAEKMMEEENFPGIYLAWVRIPNSNFRN